MASAATEGQLADWRMRALKLENEVKMVIVGQDAAIRLINIAIFARGHVMLEGGWASAKLHCCNRWRAALAAIMSALKARWT